MRVSIDTDSKALVALSKQSESIRNAIRVGIKKAMLFAEGESKQRFNTAGNLNVKSGRLRSSITAGASDLKGWIESRVVYALIHEVGGHIRPTNKSALRFAIEGNWHTVKKVVIPARPFLEPAIKNNMDKIGEIIIKEVIRSLE